MKAAEEMKKEQKEVKLRMILQDYHRRNDYELQQAVNDILALDALPPAEGAEIDDMMFTISEDGINPLNEKPTSEGAEDDDEIILGEPDKLNLQWSGYDVLGNCKQRKQLTNEGAEEIQILLKDFYYHMDEWMHIDNADDFDVEINSWVKNNINRFATLHAQKIAEGAEEILPAAYEWHNIKTGHCYVDYVPHLDAKDGYTKTPLYSTLHAQKIADKMVEERLREELIKYDRWMSGNYWGVKQIPTPEQSVELYLKSREK
jgi:hypothetical protein